MPSGLFESRLFKSKKEKKQKSIGELQRTVFELEQEQAAFGAPGIEQDRPGVFRTVLDILSRPNFAIAGITEELLQGRSVTSGVTRAMAEIFSGVGGIQGEKRAFGEVMENLGVGTKTLADAFPALEGTWVGNFGSRGAAGIALDIATDPLTYMTFGASAGARIATSKGIRFLNKAGLDEFGKLFKQSLDETLGRAAGDDLIAQTRAFDQARDLTEKKFEQLFSDGGDIAKEFLEPGGAKLFGAKIPGTDKIGGAVGRAVDMLPERIAKPVVEGATEMRNGMARALNGIFSPEGTLANLPQPLREKATRLTNSFFRASGAHRSHLLSQVDPLEDIYRKLEKADPKIGERWYDVREGVLPRTAITNPEELAAFDATMGLYDSMGKTLLAHGILDDVKILPNYIFHQYKNIEDLAQFHPRPGTKLGIGTKPSFEKDRIHESFRVAQEESERFHKLQLEMLSRGELKDTGLYPILEPEFDVFKNMRDYVQAHADSVGRKAWREEMTQQFGKRIDELDFGALYGKLDNVDTPKGVGAPKDFTPENVPIRRAIEQGDIEERLRDVFGADGAQYVAVKGVHTGDELVYLPKAIAESMEGVNSSLFNTKDYKEFGKLLKGFDWINNNFKWGVYTVWPASAFRDGYSNIALAMLRIGAAAMNPAKHVDAVKLMAGRNLAERFAKSDFTIGQLRDLSKTLGVWVPGKVFVEQTGKFKLGKARAALTEARAGIENEARVMLWLEEIRRGADPRTAADTVGQFLFNYGEVSRVERDLFRRLIPFYTFTRKNIELQWKTLKSRPGLQVNQLKPFRGRTDENEQMVQWEAEALKMRMDRNGRTVHMLTGIDLPLRNIDTIWRGDLKRTGRSIMGMVTPVLKTIPEVLLNRDFFLGRDLTRTQSGAVGRLIETLPTPGPVKDWLGYKKEVDDARRPKYTFDGARFTLLFRSWALSRAVSTSDRQFRQNIVNGEPDVARMALDVLTGLRVKELDLDEQTRRKLFFRIRQLEESLARRGRRGTFQRRFKPKRVEEADFR